MGLRSTSRYIILAVVAIMPAFAQQGNGNGQQLGQWCHSGLSDPQHGLYCTAINASFVPQQGSGYLTSIEVLNGKTTPITGTLTFAPGPNVIANEDDEDANGNPVCYQHDANGNIVYDSNGNPVTIPCPQYASYDITDWDITIGTTHLYRSSANPQAANSGCGNGYSDSIQTSNNSITYYLCGNNVDTASTGLIVIVVPLHFLMGGKNNTYTDLAASATDANGTFWDSGLYLPDAGPNCSTVAALGPQSKPATSLRKRIVRQRRQTVGFNN